jgi:hypothetical protein
MSQRRSPSIVAGAGATPARSSSSADLPGWLWSLIGCLSVLCVGFGGLWWMSSMGMAPSQLLHISSGGSSLVATRGDKTSSRSAGPLQAGIQVEPIAVPAVPVAPPPVAVNEARRPAPRPHPMGAAVATRVTKLAVVKPGAAAARPGAPAAAAADDKPAVDDGAEPARPAAAAVRDVSPTAADDKDTAKIPAVLRQISGPDEDTPRVAAPKAQVEAALTALAPRVRRCFFKFQIPGRAQVGLVVNPTGEPESVTVSGDFEGTPTGQCIADEVAAATLPSFKGAPMKLNYTYQLR